MIGSFFVSHNYDLYLRILRVAPVDFCGRRKEPQDSMIYALLFAFKFYFYDFVTLDSFIALQLVNHLEYSGVHN